MARRLATGHRWWGRDENKDNLACRHPRVKGGWHSCCWATGEEEDAQAPRVVAPDGSRVSVVLIFIASCGLSQN